MKGLIGIRESILKDMGDYNLISRNCHTFARRVWNSITMPQKHTTWEPDIVKRSVAAGASFGTAWLAADFGGYASQ